jgi:hypothetical protein
MGIIMIKCRETGRAISTGIKAERDDFRRTPVFFARTRCPICEIYHEWFAREAWVDESQSGALRLEGSRVLP